jgi:hypothetical protein
LGLPTRPLIVSTPCFPNPAQPPTPQPPHAGGMDQRIVVTTVLTDTRFTRLSYMNYYTNATDFVILSLFVLKKAIYMHII